MADLSELDVYKKIVEDCFTLTLNMNDAFHWACADAQQLEADDVPKIVPICQRYGVGPTTLAYAAICRGYDSDHKKLLTPDYFAAKAELQAMAGKGEILWERWDALNDAEEQKAEFGGQIVEWKNSLLTQDTTKYRFARLLNKPGQGVCVMQVAKLADGTLAIGRSINETLERLRTKYKRLHP